MEKKLGQLKKWIEESNKIVFFGGAGISTESGIPDFRSVDGLYNQKYDYPPEKILSLNFYKENPEEFFKFYKEKMLFLDVKPNKGHTSLFKLEEMGKLKAIITQNIDGLHQKAGSKNVLELHGSVLRNYCEDCGKEYSANHIKSSKGVPSCECGGRIKPDIVLYEEFLDNEITNKAIKAIRDADMLIVGGTSLSVYPAAGFVEYYFGNKLVLINKSPTSFDSFSNLCIRGSFGELIQQVLNSIK